MFFQLFIIIKNNVCVQLFLIKNNVCVQLCHIKTNLIHCTYYKTN